MASTSAAKNHALVLGASGITGWAIVNQILRDYPTPDTFSRVTALTNRPLDRGRTLWPEDKRLNIVNGIDLLRGSQTDLERELESKVEDIGTVSKLYFYSYKFYSDPEEESVNNHNMLMRTVRAIEKLSPHLNYVVLPSGTKAYGVHLGGDLFPFKTNLPLKEDLPRIPEPYASRLFYYHQLDVLRDEAVGKKWTWCDLRPDVIVGFVPNNNTYCLAQSLAVYLSLFRAVEGENVECPFPGSHGCWTNLSNDSSQDIVARFSIYASLHPELTSGGSFNVADNDTPSSWSAKWPVICDWFGLKGVGPSEGSQTPAEYLRIHRNEWNALAVKHNLGKDVLDVETRNGKGGYQHHIMSELDFDRSLDMALLRKVGFPDSVDSHRSWWQAFERFREARRIP